MIKRFIIAIILLVIVCGGIVGFNIFRANAIKQYFATMQQPAAVVSTVTVKPMTWQPGIDAIGTVNARQGVDVAVETSGTVTEINFDANQKVEKGDLLVQLDDEVERADLASAQSALKLAQDNLKRIRQLAQRGVSATSNLDTAQSEATQAQSTVEKLKAVLDQKQLKAPFSGVIGIPKIDLGQYLTAGTAVATLQHLETMRVDFTVPEQEFSNLKLGQTIKVGLNEGDLRFTGEIIGINPKIDPSSRLVTVRGEVDNPNEELQPGQFVHVEVQLPVEHDVIALPQTAVTTSLYGDFVFVVRKQDAEPENTDGQTDEQPTASVNTDSAKTGTQKADGADAAEENKTAAAQDKQDAAQAKEGNLVVKQVFVQIGRRSGQLVEITKGVEAGDVVVSAGQNRLSNGMPVTIDNTVNPADTSRKEAGL